MAAHKGLNHFTRRDWLGRRLVRSSRLLASSSVVPLSDSALSYAVVSKYIWASLRFVIGSLVVGQVSDTEGGRGEEWMLAWSGL